VVYEHGEAWFHAESIRKAGAGLSALLDKITARTFAEAVEHVSASTDMQERALKLAGMHAHFRNADPVQAVADLAIKLMKIRLKGARFF
jgi:UDP:flavonoid glycosyltransferase YjiC (YdhE family)